MISSLVKLSIGVLVGCALVWLGLGDTLISQTQRNWSSATATIVESSIAPSSYSNEGPQIKLQVRFETQGKARRAVLYTYDFDREGDGIFRRVFTEKIPRRYETGQTLAIFYNSAEPDQVRLTAETVSTTSWILIVFGVLIAGTCLFFAALDLFIAFQIWRMNYYLAKAKQDFAEGKALLSSRNRQMLETNRYVPRSIHDNGLVEALETQIANVTAVADQVNDDGSRYFDEVEDDTPSSNTHSDDHDRLPSAAPPVRSGLISTSLSLLLPILLGLSLSWFVPYHVITLQAGPDAGVSGHVQPVLLGMIPVGAASEAVNITGVETEKRGKSRSSPLYLTLLGTPPVTIRADNAHLTKMNVMTFLKNPAGAVTLSDGSVFLGLYAPWVLVWFGLVAALITLERPTGNGQGSGGPVVRVSNQSNGVPKRVVSFVIGMFVAWCIISFVYVYVRDVYQADTKEWLAVLAVALVGGVINSWRSGLMPKH